MKTKTRIELKMLLVDVDDERDACLDRLRDILQAKRGIEHIHTVGSGEHRPGELCIHFDHDLVSLQDVRHFARQAGLGLQEAYGHLQMNIDSRQERRAKQIARSILDKEGVLEAVVSGGGAVRVEFDREQISIEQVRNHVERVSGARDESEKPSKAEHDAHVHGGVFGERTELIFVALCGVALVLGWVLPKLMTIPQWVQLSISIGAYFFGGWFTVKEAWTNLRSGRFEIDSLMLVAAAGAASLGAWPSPW